jgi:hypothetical protein
VRESRNLPFFRGQLTRTGGAWLLAAAAVLVPGVTTLVLYLAASANECYWDDPYGSATPRRIELTLALVVGPAAAAVLAAAAFLVARPRFRQTKWRYVLAVAIAVATALAAVWIAGWAGSLTSGHSCD